MNTRTFAHPGVRFWLSRIFSPRKKSLRVGPAVMVVPPRPVVVFRAKRGASLYVISGEVWLTEEGVSEDVCLSAGQVYSLRGTGKVILEGGRGTSVCRLG